MIQTETDSQTRMLTNTDGFLQARDQKEIRAPKLPLTKAQPIELTDSFVVYRLKRRSVWRQ